MTHLQGVAVWVTAVTLGGGLGCASKGDVANEVEAVNSRIQELSQSVEENRQRVALNGARIAEVDQTAASAARLAEEAAIGAESAGTFASSVADSVDLSDRAARRLVYEVVLNETQGNFAFNQIVLPDEAKVALDGLVALLKAEPMNVFIEIEGHTDSTGSTRLNQRIGRERAEAVRLYLFARHQVPLHKMSVLTYGEEKPLAPNTTGEGRAKNRRVVVRVLT